MGCSTHSPSHASFSLFMLGFGLNFGLFGVRLGASTASRGVCVLFIPTVGCGDRIFAYVDNGIGIILNAWKSFFEDSV